MIELPPYYFTKILLSKLYTKISSYIIIRRLMQQILTLIIYIVFALKNENLNLLFVKIIAIIRCVV